MLKKYYSVFGPALRAIDAFILVGCWVGAYFLRKHYPIISLMREPLPRFRDYGAYAILIVLLWWFVFSITKLYSSQRMTRRTIEAYRVLRAHSLSLLIFLALTYLFSVYKISRSVFFVFSISSGLLLVWYRLILRNTLRAMRTKGYNLQRILIVGTGTSAKHAYEKLSRHPELGLHVEGFVASGTNPRAESPIPSVPMVGIASDITALIKKYEAQKVVIALSRLEAGELETVLNAIKDEFVDLIMVPDIYEYIALGCEVEDFDGLPLVNLNDFPLAGWGAYAKRGADIVLSALALIVLSPVMLLIAAAVKLTSRGPVFYGQERMGLDGQTFKMYKFRSMRIDAESSTGAVWAKPGDDRRTPIGAFLRATSLDELPQFWNVFKGEMSLVGPRPERPIFVDQFRKDIPHYMLRHKVKAGITGWAQINGWRGNTSLEKRIEYDLYYIKNWSMLFDLKILFLTVFKGFINRNAY